MKSIFRPIDTAFAILFVLLIAVCVLHVTTAADFRTECSPETLQVTEDLERFRTLEKHVDYSIDLLQADSIDPQAKFAVLTLELGRIENALTDLGRSGVRVAGLTRLVEPYIQIGKTKSQLNAAVHSADDVLLPGGPLERALRATQFVVRSNITRLGEEKLAATASVAAFGNRATLTAVLAGLAAMLAFAPVRIMAGRAAAKPIETLKSAARAVADERWSPVGVECQSDDAVGELVVAFHTMAAKLRESREERATTFQRTLTSLVQTIEAKDPYVSNHSVNVAMLAEELARAAGVSDAEAREIACGALLHDIGKIGVPDEIINKPGKLTQEEFAVIQKHPVIGDRIVTPLDGSDVLHAPVRHHHEHWDGTGYPDGLRGEEIPLAARIIKIADVFEALTSDRSYRSKMSVERAVEIMRGEAGTKLDPQLVEIFLTRIVPRMVELLPGLHPNSASPAESTIDAASDDLQPVTSG